MAIKLRSLHCNVEDIREAVYNLRGRLDAEALHDVYSLRASTSELDDIRQHQLHQSDGAASGTEFLNRIIYLFYIAQYSGARLIAYPFCQTKILI